MTHEYDGMIADMVVDFIKEFLTEDKKEQIKKALRINEHLTSVYGLDVEEVQDIKGRDSKTSGWYVILKGTRCGVNFFINNDFEIVRKPRNVEVMHRYNLHNNATFYEGFWLDLKHMVW